jgi:hypothetical protein
VTTTLERIPVDRISRQAAEVRTGHALLSVIAAVFYAVGYAAGRIVPMLMWCGFAIREGFRPAHGPSRKMQVAMLTAEVDELRMQLSRFTTG